MVFRLGKRNFSLRDSPKDKLSSLSPRPKLQSDSPAKRLKFGDANQLLSSTLLSESRITDGSKLDCIKSDTNQEVEKSSFFIQEKSCNEQEAGSTKVPVETPPPTPELNIVSVYEIMNKQKLALMDESERLDNQIDAKIRALDECQREIDQLRASRLKYEDYTSMVTRGQNEIRDHLNLIFTPGNELAQKFEPIMQELWNKNTTKLEKKTFEWNCQIDQARSVIAKRIEDLNHEMELHKRTLLHKEHINKAQDESMASGDAEKEKAAEPCENSIDSENLRDEGHDTEDCIIIGTSDDAIDVNEGTTDGQPVEATVVKQENDDEETDVEDAGEESRSFTPCQAQRAE